MTLLIGAHALTPKDVIEVAREGRKVGLSPKATRAINRAHRALIAEAQSGKTIYGVNTGFGLLSNVCIETKDIEQLQLNLIRSHATGMGSALPDPAVRAMLLLRASTLALGHSGVSLGLVQALIDLLNKNVCPIIPEQGSVGASGDLAPLAHLALVLLGEGRARVGGQEMTGAQALKTARLKPVVLGVKEGLALINGTQFMTALGCLALSDAELLADAADFIGGLSLEALRGTSTAFDEKIHRVRPHPGQVLVAERLRTIVGKSEIAKSHKDCERVQDPYSLRCMPQVHGASRDVLRWVRQVLECEINSVTDNPLVFPAESSRKTQVLSGGNFHGQIVAIAMDMLAIAVAELASISEQRIEKLVNPAISGLPAFLTEKGGLNSGFMIVQVAAASIVSENKTLCHPASVDTIPTSADKEDHVSMGAWAARKAQSVVTNARRVLAMEWVSAAQGIDLLRPLKTSSRLERLHAFLRQEVKRLHADRVFHDDLVKAEELLQSKKFRSLIAKG